MFSGGINRQKLATRISLNLNHFRQLTKNIINVHVHWRQHNKHWVQYCANYRLCECATKCNVKRVNPQRYSSICITINKTKQRLRDSLKAIAIVGSFVTTAANIDSMRLYINGTLLDGRQTSHCHLPAIQSWVSLSRQCQLPVDVCQSQETFKPRPDDQVQQRWLRPCQQLSNLLTSAATLLPR